MKGGDRSLYYIGLPMKEISFLKKAMSFVVDIFGFILLGAYERDFFGLQQIISKGELSTLLLTNLPLLSTILEFKEWIGNACFPLILILAEPELIRSLRVRERINQAPSSLMVALLLVQSHLELSLTFDSCFSHHLAMAVDNLKPVVSAMFPRKTVSPPFVSAFTKTFQQPRKQKQANKQNTASVPVSMITSEVKIRSGYQDLIKM